MLKRKGSTLTVRCDENTLLKVLELLVTLDTLVLRETTVNADRGEIALLEQLVELVGTADGLDKDDDLVEL
jgi:hypothetical protein